MNGVGFAVGLAFGFVLAAARLNEYDVIHNMLLLRDFEPFLLMGSAVATAAPLLWLMRRRGWRTRFGGIFEPKQGQVERKHVLGAVVFGSGWAISASCPGPLIAMTAGGALLGLPVMLGLFGGLHLRDLVAQRPRGGATSAEPPLRVKLAPTQ